MEEKDNEEIKPTPKPDYWIKQRIKSGSFETIETWDSKGEKHEKTVYHDKNPAKVLLGSISNITYYVYPFDYPDKVFINSVGDKHFMDKYDAIKMVAINNKIRWYLNGGLQKSLSNKSKSTLAQQIRLAYEYQRSKKVGQ